MNLNIKKLKNDNGQQLILIGCFNMQVVCVMYIMQVIKLCDL